MVVKPLRIDAAFEAGIDDVFIFPLVMIALVLKHVLKAALLILIHVLDVAFLIVMELVRFPLFAVRALGDGAIGGLRALVARLPVQHDTRQRWSTLIGQKWVRIRRAISYKAFEQAVHHAFERGMEWVFRKCRTLSPRTALYVIFGAILWLPISMGLATGMHALLLANATSLPPWMQLLHPFATLIAKSKLLVIPVYPAAWPQAKKHPLVQTIGRAYRDFEDLYLIQKLEHRYRQTQQGMRLFIEEMHRIADMVGLGRVCRALWSGVCIASVRIADWYRNTKFVVFQRMARTRLIGPLVRSYLTHLDRMERRNEKISDKVRRGFDRWYVKFSAEYYEAKEAEQAARAAAEGVLGIHPPPDPAVTPLKPSKTG
jgi:hypothetical protein